jgi:chromosome segregation ATPase
MEDQVAQALAVVEQRARRREEIRMEIARLDTQLQELNRGAALLLADGEAADGVPNALRERRASLREALVDHHAALSELDGLVAAAVEDVEAYGLERAREEYGRLRAQEAKAAQKVQRAGGALGRALSELREASCASYEVGLGASVETATHYSRRLRVGEGFMRTIAGPFYSELRVPLRSQVPDFSTTWGDILPAIPVVDEEEGDDDEA